MSQGEKIKFIDNTLRVPDRPIIPFVEGDGIGPDIWAASMRVFDAAVKKAYGRRRRIQWLEIYAGEKAYKKFGEWLPERTLDAIREHIVAIKGPLGTPVGGGIRSLNVALRQSLDLFSCVRPVSHIRGVPSPVRNPEKLNVIIFRENTEDVYSGIEWPEGSPEARKLIKYLSDKMGVKVRHDSGIGVKPISRNATKRLMRMAVSYAIKNKRRSVTLVHKGNIMKYTEGAFREWGYQLAREEFGKHTVSEEDVQNKHGGKVPEGKIVINDRIADSMFQQILLRPEDYDVIVTPNLNGDYLSDACAAQVGGIGMVPGANIGVPTAEFEAVHGTAPKYAGQDKVNPSSLILSGVMMFEYLGWDEAAGIIKNGIEKTILQKKVTYDLERQMEGATLLKCSEFATEIIERM